MNLGYDGGYNAVKAVTEARRVSFPSVTGTPERARFSLNGHVEDIVLTIGHDTWLIGESAISQSRFVQRREDRAWIQSPEYYRLFMAALTELTTASWVDLVIVTGLPVSFFSDKDTLVNRLIGEHRCQREGRNGQLFKVTDVRVIPQPFGALLAEALDNRGQIANQDLASGRVGVIDAGGKTTNLLSVSHLAEIGKETASVNVGAWDLVRRVREYLADHCPELDLRDHQIVDAIKARQVKYYGSPVDLGRVVDEALEPMAAQVISQAGQLWNGGAGLDAILIAGGGAHLLGPRLQRQYRHARIVESPVYSNAIGYWKLSQRLK